MTAPRSKHRGASAPETQENPMTHAPLYDHEIPDATTALSELLARVEGEVCDPAAYGYRIEDLDHPWHETVMNARDALWKARRDRDRDRRRLYPDEAIDWAGRVMTAIMGVLAGLVLGGVLNSMTVG